MAFPHSCLNDFINLESVCAWRPALSSGKACSFLDFLRFLTQGDMARLLSGPRADYFDGDFCFANPLCQLGKFMSTFSSGPSLRPIF